MDPVRFSTLAHRHHVFCSPLGPETVERVLDRLEMLAPERVLDVGCGIGELLVRVLERCHATGVGVDPNPDYLEVARRRARERGVEDRLELRASRAEDAGLEPGFQLALTIGATHAFGGFRPTLDALRGLLVGGGWMLVGEGYWKCDPDPGYLSLLGGTRDEFTDHQGNLEAAAERGLTALDWWLSSDAEWDEYEGLYADAIERHLREHPDDPDREAMKLRIEHWQEGYRRWGRHTLGFGLYLLRT